MTKKNILILTKYSRQGASSRLRTLQYLPHLEQADFDVTVSSLFDDTYLKNLYSKNARSIGMMVQFYVARLKVLLTARSYDVIWIEKEIFPYCPAFAERFLRWLGVPYVVDYDDAIFHNYDHSRHGVVRTLLGRKIDTVMRLAAHVVVGNRYLADRATTAGATQVTQIPTVVDATRYQNGQARPSSPPVIGWIGSPSTEKFLLDVAPALMTVCRDHGAKLLFVGATQQLAQAFAGVDVEIAPWSEDSEADHIARMTIGIMPLQDGLWEQGKCGYKLIQYMAMSVPVIASSVGANIDIVDRAKCGFLVDTPDDWTKAMTAFLGDPRGQQACGMSGRESVENFYCVEAQAPNLIKALTTAVGSSVS